MLNVGNLGTNYYKVVKLRKKYPCMSITTIGNKLGISGTRVEQLLVKANMPMKRMVVKYYCSKCHKEISKYNKKPFCRDCGKNELVPIICSQCGILFYREQQYITRKTKNPEHLFCNTECKGKYVGTHYGFVGNKLKRSK